MLGRDSLPPPPVPCIMKACSRSQALHLVNTVLLITGISCGVTGNITENILKLQRKRNGFTCVIQSCTAIVDKLKRAAQLIDAECYSAGCRLLQPK